MVQLTTLPILFWWICSGTQFWTSNQKTWWNIPQPARSPDLTPPDFLLWVYLKFKVFYENSSWTREKLKVCIWHEIETFSFEMLRNVIQGFGHRLRECVDKQGRRLTETIFRNTFFHEKHTFPLTCRTWFMLKLWYKFIKTSILRNFLNRTVSLPHPEFISVGVNTNSSNPTHLNATAKASRPTHKFINIQESIIRSLMTTLSLRLDKVDRKILGLRNVYIRFKNWTLFLAKHIAFWVF